MVNWNQPNENKRPIFESTKHVGVINLNKKFVAGGSIKLEVNDVILNDDPFQISQSNFTFLNVIGKLGKH